MALHRKDPERLTGCCRENFQRFENLTEAEPKSFSFPLSLPPCLPSFFPLSLPPSHLPPPSLTNQYFPLCWLHLLSLCVVEKVSYCGKYSSVPTFLGLGSPGKRISRLVSEGVPGGGEQREEDGQLNEWHHPIGYCPRLNKKGNSKEPPEHL